MKRRKFITLVGGAAAWPFAARPFVAWGQRAERTRRVAALLPATADDSVFQARIGAFLQELASLGWSIGRNLQIEIRWDSADPDEIRRHAATYLR